MKDYHHPPERAVIEPIYLEDKIVTGVTNVAVLSELVFFTFTVEHPGPYGVVETVAQVRLATPQASFACLVHHLNRALRDISSQQGTALDMALAS